MAQLLYLVGAVVSLVGGVWLLSLAWKRSILWFLGCLFIPFVAIVFAINEWGEAKQPFLLSLVGGILMGAARAALR